MCEEEDVKERRPYACIPPHMHATAHACHGICMPRHMYATANAVGGANPLSKHMHIYAHAHVCTCTCMPAHAHVCACTCNPAHAHKHTYACACTYAHVCVPPEMPSAEPRRCELRRCCVASSSKSSCQIKVGHGAQGWWDPRMRTRTRACMRSPCVRLACERMHACVHVCAQACVRHACLLGLV